MRAPGRVGARSGRGHPALGALGTAGALALTVGRAAAQAPDTTATARPAPARPTVAFHRWEEDWSVLADPAVPRRRLDGLKYLPLGGGGGRYLSLGADIRERYEALSAPSFGAGGAGAQRYVLSRVELHADLRLDRLQAFVQVADHRAPGQARPGPVSRNVLDLEQAFVRYTVPAGGGTLKLRAGRQEIAFDLQRFVSVRDGANVRQAYDALWADYERGRWRTIAFWSHPVRNRDARVFDDGSSRRLAYGGARLERAGLGAGKLSAYLSAFRDADATYLTVRGRERRLIADVRYAGAAGGTDWDLEAMHQAGRVGAARAAAWAIGTLVGHTWADRPGMPRVGLQLDAASGDRRARDARLGTFNPLFPNGYYLTLSGYSGYTNLIHLKPSLTVRPAAPVTVLAATGLQWRATTADAVYTQPNLPVPGTAGRPGAWTGQYGQLRTDWSVTGQVALALEAVYFRVGPAIRTAGGRDARYLGLEVKAGW